VAFVHSQSSDSKAQPRLPKSIQQASILSDKPIEALERFRSCMPGKLSQSGDMGAAWEAFEALRGLDTLASLSLDDLVAFALWVYDATRLPSLTPGVVPKESSARIEHLRDAFLLRVEDAVAPDLWTIKTWANCLAVHAHVISGRLDEASQWLSEKFPWYRNMVSRQDVQSLEQVFLVVSQRRSAEDGLAIVTKVWPCLRGLLRFRRFSEDDGINDAIEELRISLTSTFGTIDEASELLENLRDPSLQEFGIPIFATLYGLQESPATIYKKYCDFVARGISIPWDGHTRFFMALLSKGAYVRAYAMRKHICATLPDIGGRQKLHQLALLYADVAAVKVPGHDPLSIKAGHVARARLLDCINGSHSSPTDLLSAWEDIELSDCCIRGFKQRDYEVSLSDDELLTFAKLVIKTSYGYPEDETVPNAREFAHVLDRISAEITRRSTMRRGPSDRQSHPPELLWNSLILKGELSTALDMLVKDVASQWYPHFVRALTHLFLAALRLHGLDEAFGHLVRLWHVVIRHLDHADNRYKGAMAEESAHLRKCIYSRFAAIENPIDWITDSKKPPQAQHVASYIFFTLLCDQSNHDRARRLFEALQASKVSVSYEAHLYLLKVFTSEHALDFAGLVYDSLFKQYPEKSQSPGVRTKHVLHLGLNLSSLQGDVEHAEECFTELEARGLVTRGARQRLLHAYAVHGNTGRVQELFQRFFQNPGTKPLSTPQIADYREVIYAHVRADDMQGINQWLDEMIRMKIPPDLSTYNMILLAFSKSSDLESASAVLTRMYENDVRPDHISYTTILSIMADRKDPVSAEQLYQRAVDEGIKPDDIMTMCLMDAHVEAGSWQGVIRAFDYLQHKKNRSDRHTTHLYNTLLKAYILIGAPFDVVASVFRRFESLKLVPTIHTYTLLVQSACDSNRMDIAADLFLEMDALPSHGKAKSHVDAYVMTIIMAGFLRNGDRRKAKLVYDDMHARGLQPRAVTFGIIIHSYANERSEESLKIAEEFMQSLLTAEESQRAWLGSTPGGRSKALESVFGPLMSIYGRRLDITAVERQFDEMLAVGGQPTLVLLTMLMDAYRRVGNLEGVQHMWSEIVEVALRISQSDVFERLPAPTRRPPKVPDIPRRQANILCLPLSVYISALSTAGRHVEIATTWRQVKEWGFVYDAHNWNHLAVALVRAGEVERAFELVERVLVPYQRQLRVSLRKRSKAPRTPLSFISSGSDEDPQANEGDTEDGVGDAPGPSVRPSSRRVEAVDSSTRQQHWLTPFADEDSDPAQPLHELQQMSITWQAWRTHRVTLDVLEEAIRWLAAGRRVRPMGVETPPDQDPLRMSADEAQAFRAREREEAGVIMERIYANHPNAVWLIEQREMRGPR
jgi:pentatricopeptide repeat-containing protein PET309